jgi:parallel beta-helix repeat protein
MPLWDVIVRYKMNKNNLILVSVFALVLLAAFFMLGSEDAEADTDWPSGPITKNTVWNLKGSPYIVDGMVTVEQDVKLTVKPGVEVCFNSKDDANFADYGIVVNGELDAQGVLFTKHPANTQTTAWAGICIEGTSGLTLEDNEISSANIGIYIVDSNDITISDSTVNGCSDIGILVDYGTSQSYDISIMDCEVKGNSVTGIEFRSVYDSEISNCDVSENIVTNILLNSLGKGVNTHNVVLSNNLVKSYASTWYFTSNGIEIYGGTDIVVRECTILENNMFGMYVSDTELTVVETEIAYSTHHYGLFAWNTKLTLLNNNFHDNSYSVWAAGGSAVYSSRNSFREDFTSVVVYHTRLYMEYDNFNRVENAVSAVYDTTVTIYDCDIKGSETAGVGVKLRSAVRLRLTESTISGFYYGVMVETTPETFIEDNVFLRNRNVAISVGTNFMDIRVRIVRNLVNQGGGGIFIGGGLFDVHCTGEIIGDNIFNNVDYGIWVNYCEIPIENNQVNHASMYGIWIKVAAPQVKNNVVRNSAIGIFAEWWSDPLIQGNTVNNCDWGIYISYYCEPIIINNHITTGDHGIVCDAGSYAYIRGNFIRGFRYHGIIVYHAGADISINVVRNCEMGIYYYRSFGSVYGNHISYTDVGITVDHSVVSIKGNNFRKNKTDIRYLP